jgi:hypothetical protein
MRRGWPGALAATCLAAAIVCLGPPASLAATPTAPGTLSVTPTTVNTSVLQPFTLTFKASVIIKGGTVIMQVPRRWPAPQTQTAGAQGYTTCAGPCGSGTLSVASGAITITGLTLAPPSPFINSAEPSSIVVTYSAAPLPYSPGGTFTAMAQQDLRLAPVNTNAVQVTVDTPSQPLPTVSVSPSPATPSSTTAPPPTTASPSVSRSTSSSSPKPVISHTTHAPAGPGPGLPLSLALGLAAAFVAVLGATWFLRHRRAPVTAQSVRATASEGPPAQLSVRAIGPDATRTVRIEPNPGVAVTTLEEVER